MLQIAMTAGLILFSACNQQNNLFQTLIGLILFSTSADRVVYGILARLGISTAYSTTVQRLHTMADTSREFLKYLGLSTFDMAGHATHYILIYDNINKQQKAWHQRLSCQDHIQSGTSATIVMLQNAPDEAFNLSWYASSASSTCPQPSLIISDSVRLHSGVTPMHTV